MTGETFKTNTKGLGLTQVQLAELLDTTDRQIRRWWTDGPPPLIAVLVDLLVRGKVTVAEVQKIKAREAARG